MEFFKKLLLYLPILFLAVSIAGLFFLQEINKNKELKKETLSFAIKIKKFIYNEATNHNPEGDLLPDEWDDNFLSMIKKINQ